jgi:uncharacterized membrane protein YdjX (TVP38/TMEM64 family)
VIRGVIIVVAVVIITLVIVYRAQVSDVLSSFIKWISENPALGALCLFLVYIMASVLFIPGSILTLGAGYAFGLAFDSIGWAILLGTISVFAGAWIGSLIAMLLGRYVFRESVEKCA